MENENRAGEGQLARPGLPGIWLLKQFVFVMKHGFNSVKTCC